MKRVGTCTSGYTIAEAMIFLAVTAAMFIIAMSFLAGQQGRNEFNIGIREIQTQLNDIINDVSTGLYTNTPDFNCEVTNPTGPPQIIDPPTGPILEQGANAECTYVGNVMQFWSHENGDKVIELYTLVGRRQTGSPGTDVRTLAEAEPVVLDKANATVRLPNGISIKRITYQNISPIAVGSIGFVNRFAQNSGSGGITGTQDVDVIPVNGTSLNQLRADAKLAINSALTTSDVNPNDGIKLCFNSGGTNQHAVIVLGSLGRQINTTLTINSGPCP